MSATGSELGREKWEKILGAVNEQPSRGAVEAAVAGALDVSDSVAVATVERGFADGHLAETDGAGAFPDVVLADAVDAEADTDSTDANPGEETDEPREDAPESTPDDTDGDDGQQDADGDLGGWGAAEFDAPESNVYPTDHLDREQWMCAAGESGKQPFSPWTDPDAPAPCSKEGHTDASECGCDARWKWGYTENYGSAADAAAGQSDRRVDGCVFIQFEEDPFAFVDGDDVRCPETGEVHPAFVAVLEHLGLTYADVSQSGSGVHAMYRGELPKGIPQTSWEIDSEPWGANDDTPEIEIYANKHVCMTTGEHVPGTPTEVRQWNADVLEPILGANDELPKRRPGDRERDRPDMSDHEPSATGSGELTSDIRDVYAAIDRLDARNVARDTIIAEETPDAPTSGSNVAFAPTWGGSNCSGTANIVHDRFWQDTGGSGWGGPVVMALIDLGRLSPTAARPSDVYGELWRDGVAHLRDLGYSIPVWVPEKGANKKDGGTYDEMPYWAVRKAAVALGLLDEDEFVTGEGDDGSNYQRFPDGSTYNRALDAVEEAGLTHGRRKADAGSAPTRKECGLDDDPETEDDEIGQMLLEGARAALK